MSEDSYAQLAVIDDDPTGSQSASDVTVLLRWTRKSVERSLRDGPAYLLTNSRALAPAAARRAVRSAASAAAGAGATRVIMRGDSTLRAHLLEEYLGWVDAVAGRPVPLLLVPALPSAGRVTVGGIHYLKRDGALIPLQQTDYSRDPRLGYSTSRLADWAEERSGGYFAASRSREVALAALRSSEGVNLARALVEQSAEPAPAVCVPDACDLDDLRLIARGMSLAEQQGARFAVRCGPALAAVLGGRLAAGPVSAPPIKGSLLVVCGSYVETSTRQIEAVVERFPYSRVEVDVTMLVRSDAGAAMATALAGLMRTFKRSPVAVLTTSRSFAGEARSAGRSMLVAKRLAEVVREIAGSTAMVIGKGGVTSAVVAKHGLRGVTARVKGPLMPGVALWNLRTASQTMPFVVFPGNVGEPESLVNLIEAVLRG